MEPNSEPSDTSNALSGIHAQLHVSPALDLD